MNGLNMNPVRASRSVVAFTRTELLVVVVALLFAFSVIAPGVVKWKQKARRIQCVSFLKQIGLAHRVFANDHTNAATGTGLYTMSVSTNDGGSREFIGTGQAFRHYLKMSNELGSAKVLVCWSDRERTARPDFTSLANSNVSYFVGLGADELKPNLLLAGDRQLTNDLPRVGGIMTVTTNQTVRWANSIHQGAGNVALADGSVQQSTTAAMNNQIRGVTQSPGWEPSTALNLTNRLEFP